MTNFETWGRNSLWKLDPYTFDIFPWWLIWWFVSIRCRCSSFYMLQLNREEHYIIKIKLILICSTKKKIVLITLSKTSATCFVSFLWGKFQYSLLDEENLNMWLIYTDAINQGKRKRLRKAITRYGYNVISLLENPSKCKLSRSALVLSCKSFYSTKNGLVLFQIFSLEPRVHVLKQKEPAVSLVKVSLLLLLLLLIILRRKAKILEILM